VKPVLPNDDTGTLSEVERKMAENAGDGIEYPDEAGYPDGSGFLSETQTALVSEVTSAQPARSDINFYIVDNEESRTYDAVSGDTLLGGITYDRRGDVVTLIATSVFPEFRGQGVATELIRKTLDDIRSHGLTVRVQCPIVAAFLDGHREYDSLVEKS